MATPLPVPKSDFIGLDGVIHLASGGEPPLLQTHRQAFENFAADKANGFQGYAAHWSMADRVREQIADLVGLDADSIALTANASDGIAKVVSSFTWKSGDSVVVAASDYASGRYALAELRERGVAVRLVEPRGWLIDEDDLIDARDRTTKLVYVAQVNAYTGQCLDIRKLSSAFAGGDTALLVDASHALGVVPVHADLADFTVSAHYKFALGIHDGMLAWNRRAHPDFTPQGVGWWSAEAGPTPDSFQRKPDARRAEFGNVDHLGHYLLSQSLDYLHAAGIDAIASHVRKMCGHILDGYRDLGLEIMTPTNPGQRAGNACFHHPDAASIMAELKRRNILVWGDHQRVRASCHLFTTRSDIDAYLNALTPLVS